jgi:MFS family permease
LRLTFISFANRDFRYLGLSTLALGFGQWAQQIGLAWLAFDLTGSAVQLGAISAFRAGVGTVTAPLGGFLADRYPRRRVIIWSTAASVIQAGLLAGLILAGMIQMWHVYALALAGGLIQSFTQPARQAFVYDISTDETLVNAIAMNSMVQNMARIAAPPLTGAMIGFWGTAHRSLFLPVRRLSPSGSRCSSAIARGKTS